MNFSAVLLLIIWKEFLIGNYHDNKYKNYIRPKINHTRYIKNRKAVQEHRVKFYIDSNDRLKELKFIYPNIVIILKNSSYCYINMKFIRDVIKNIWRVMSKDQVIAILLVILYTILILAITYTVFTSQYRSHFI